MQRRRFLKSSLLGSLSLAGLPYLNQAASGQTFEWKGKKILFLGDSITQAGDYINFLESSLLANSGKLHAELLNLGLASETISGLSEEAHPFPRPYLHDRLSKVLSATQPDIIFTCYGINCGIYHPFERDIFRTYQQGITQLMKAADNQKAELILMTPPPYAVLVDDRALARADVKRDDFSYAKPYLAYDDVMRKYAEWLLSLQGEVKVIDLQTPLRKFVSLCYDQDYIHPNRYGHQLMAITILETLEWTPAKASLDVKMDSLHHQQENSFGQTWEASMPRLPYRVYTGQQAYDSWIAGPEVKLVLENCSPGTYQLFDHNVLVGQYKGETLKTGIFLNHDKAGEMLKSLAPWQLSEKIYELIAAKRNLYDYSLLQHIGHERPMSREGLPISLAEKKRDEIRTQLRALLVPKRWKLNLVQLGQ